MHSSSRSLALGLALLAASCGDDPSASPVVDPGDGGRYAPRIDPAGFVEIVDNPFLPLGVGGRWVYEGESDGEKERIEVVVTDQRREVMGVSTVVVRDTVTVAGQLVEDTYDWYAQDRVGNVWYFGEDVKDFEAGKVVSTAGSWEAGVDGALPGIVMPARPAVGETFRQEFYRGQAEDMFEIIRVDGTLTVPYGRFADVLVTRDWTPLDAAVVEEKYYARGPGKIREEKAAGGKGFVELVTYTPGR